MLQVDNLTVRYGNLTIVDDVGFSLLENQWLMVVGPNGAGKSTVVNAIAQGVRYSGTVRFEGQDVKQFKPARRAQNIGVLSQSQSVSYPFTVKEVVRLGRYSYAPGIFDAAAKDDSESVQQALRRTGLQALAEQSVLTLSGGELQRVFLAQVLAQNPRLLILDEPTNHLDLVYQKQVFELIAQWVRQPGRAVISVVHNLSLARAFGTQVMLMDKGRVVSRGRADEVLSREKLQSVYSMDVYAWMQSMLGQWRENSAEAHQEA